MEKTKEKDAENMKQVNFQEAMEFWAKPERIVLVTSTDAEGQPQVMTVGWKMRTSFQPPMLAISVGVKRNMHKCIMESKEFVIAVPGAELAKGTLLCGISSPEKIDRFKQGGFITKPGNFISSPLIENCIANFECKLAADLPTGDHTIFVGEVVASWINETPSKNLLIIGEDGGTELLAAQGPYRIGVLR